VSVVSTFLVMGLVVLGFRAGRWVAGKWKTRGRGWWRFWRWGVWKWRSRLVDVRRERDEERTPMLVPGDRGGGV
jgi:hypothetical protein